MPPPSKAALQWHLQWGENEEFLMEREEETGEDSPALERKPALTGYQSSLLSAFFLLSPDRPISMGGAGAMPTAGILAMAAALEEEPLAFLHLCRELDGVYMEWLASRPKT